MKSRINFVTMLLADGEEMGRVTLIFHLDEVYYRQAPKSYVEAVTMYFRMVSDFPQYDAAYHHMLEATPKPDHDRVDRENSLLTPEVMAKSKAHIGEFCILWFSCESESRLLIY